ncbi:WD repeat-containing protein 6, partial [Coelomomyces lativittatus]
MCGQGPYVLLGPSQGPLHCYQSITSPTSTPPTTTTMTTSSMILSPTLSSSFTLSVPTTYQQVKSIGEDYWMVQDAHSLWVYQKNILKRTWTWTEWVLDAIVWEHGLVVATRSSQVVCFYWHTDTVDRVDAHHHQQAVTSLAWIPRGTSLCLVSGGRDGFLNVWETHSEHSSLSLTWMYGERISKGWVEKLITPITALGYLNESFVLIGIGSTIYIWDVALDHLHPLHGVLESPFQWISAYHVYGFLVVHTTEPLTKSCLERGWNGKIGVYGGNEFIFIQLSFQKTQASLTGVQADIHVISRLTTTGWILSTHSLEIENSIAWVTVHLGVFVLLPSNEILKFGMDTYCVIYSAAMHGTTLASLIIASGAPTQKIVLRKLNIKTSMTEIMGEFIGHEGAIFGLAFHSSGKWLVSTSEDRSVRVWCTQTYECTYCYYGHLARVWQAMFLQDYVVSISEDAQCRFWKLGKCRFIGEGHRGQHIWKLQVNPNETQVVTGGNDGVVRVWNLKDIEQ